MAVDVNILKQGLEKLTGLRPLPRWEHLNDYVIAFYYPENDFLEWVTQHPGNLSTHTHTHTHTQSIFLFINK